MRPKVCWTVDITMVQITLWDMLLKARICKLLDLDIYPEKEVSFKTHNLEKLLMLSGLEKQLEIEKMHESFLDLSWSDINKWSESLRYNAIGTTNSTDCSFRYISVVFIFNWIKSKW